jgi:hypothetical protein
MELLNFKIEDGIYFVTNDKELDIHNNYDCSGFRYDFKNRQIIISWTKSQGDWVPENLPSALELSLNDVSVFKSKERDPEMPFSEDNCIAEIGFAHHDINNDELNTFLAAIQSNDFSLFSLWFQSGFCLYVDAKSAELKLQ